METITDIDYPKKRIKKSMSLQTHLETGQKMDTIQKSNSSDLWEIEDCMIQGTPIKFSSKMKLILKEIPSSMSEPVPTITEEILNDKSNASKNNIIPMKSFRILVQDSTGIERDFKEFWNESTKELSQKLWSPTKIACVDSDMNYSNGSVKNTMLNSWFSISHQKRRTEVKNYPKIYCQLSQSLSQKIMECAQPIIGKKETIYLKTKKIKLLPNQKQTEKLNQWFGTYRYVYNQALSLFSQGKEAMIQQYKNKLSSQLNQQIVQNYKPPLQSTNEQTIVTNLPLSSRKKIKLSFTLTEQPTPEWLLNCLQYLRMVSSMGDSWAANLPAPIKAFIYNEIHHPTMINGQKPKPASLLQMLRELFVKNDNYDNNQSETPWVKQTLPADTRDRAILELYEHICQGYKDIKRFPKYYKSKKLSQSIEFRKERQYGTKGQYQILREIQKTALVPILNHDFKIQKDSHGYFYMVIPMDVCKNENKVPTKIISLDPGVRKFLTGYTVDGSVYYFGEGDIEYLAILNHRKQRLQSKIALMKSKGRSYHRHVHALERQSYKIKNLVNDAHHKIAKWLFENFEYIIIPKLDVGSFLRNPKMSKRSKNNLKAWRHGAFIDYLKYKNFEYLGSKLIIPTEEYTTKTCSHCGSVDHGFTSSEDYLCPNPKCSREFDRDANSALNILLKTLTH